MEEATVGVHDQVMNTTFVVEIIGVNDVRVVVGMKQEQFVVHSLVKQTCARVYGRGTQVKGKRGQ